MEKVEHPLRAGQVAHLVLAYVAEADPLWQGVMVHSWVAEDSKSRPPCATARKQAHRFTAGQK